MPDRLNISSDLRPKPLRPQPSTNPTTSSNLPSAKRNPASGSEPGSTARSKKGCWTCRMRKVKCDENKPICGQCERLSYACDWKARLHFKDDTPKIVQRMPAVHTSGNSVWDPASTTGSGRASSQDTEDILPPFAHLTNDEQREQKAALHEPGTFIVVANHNTFSSLPEYRTDDKVSEGFISVPDDSKSIEPYTVVEPNSIILQKFEEGGEGYEPSPASNSSIPNQGSPYSQSSGASRLISETESNRYTTQPEGTHLNHPENTRLLDHYRNVLARQLCPLSDWVDGQDLFVRYASDYTPLLLAIMALSSLSLACLENRPVADALERHQHVIPALKREVRTFEDSFSDGALFTHYFLLRFEAAAAGHRESNMWDYHSDQLLSLLRLRHKAYGPEKRNFILVWAMYIDVYGLLTTSANGSFTKAILQEGMLPAPERALEQAKPGDLASGLLLSSDAPQLLKMNRQLTLLALKFGLQAQELRAKAGDSQTPVDSTALQQRLSSEDDHTLLADFYSTWSIHLSPSENWLEKLAVLPTALFTLRIHAHLLYRACVIYYHTSMYPGQLSKSDAESEKQVEICAREILQIAGMIIDHKRFEFRYILFPVFLAGFASRDTMEKSVAVELIRNLEKTSYGMSTKSTRRLLETVYQKQQDEMSRTGKTSVNWIEVLKLSGEKLIIFGI